MENNAGWTTNGRAVIPRDGGVRLHLATTLGRNRNVSGLIKTANN